MNDMPDNPFDLLKSIDAEQLFQYGKNVGILYCGFREEVLPRMTDQEGREECLNFLLVCLLKKGIDDGDFA